MGNDHQVCYTCGAELKRKDSDSGRAVILLGRHFCETCMERTRELSRPSAKLSRKAHLSRGDTDAAALSDNPFERSPEEIEGIQRLTEVRKAPPFGAGLHVRKLGALGLLGANAVVLWLDVSIRGCRAILSGSFEKGSVHTLTIHHAGLQRRVKAHASIETVDPSEQHPGAFLVGFRFENRTPQLEEFVALLIEESGRTSPSRSLRARSK